MKKVMLMLGTRKGAFLAFADADRRAWEIEGPFLKGVEVNHVGWTSGKIFATVKSYWFGPDVRISSDFGVTVTLALPVTLNALEALVFVIISPAFEATLLPTKATLRAAISRLPEPSPPLKIRPV